MSLLSGTREFINKTGKLKKYLGQNFLVDENITKKIAGAVEEALSNLPQSSPVFEIGPGIGALTQFIPPAVFGRLTLIEKDRTCVERLEEIFSKSVSIYAGDVLKYSGFPDAPYMVYGNLPYNISTPLLFRLYYKLSTPPAQAVFMVQKEVALRVVMSGNSKVSTLGLAINNLCDARILFDVPPGAFSPPPKVQSSVILLSLKQGCPGLKERQSFLKFVEPFFNFRRKKIGTIINHLNKAGYTYSQMAFDKYIDMRPEDLSLADWRPLFSISLPAVPDPE